MSVKNDGNNIVLNKINTCYNYKLQFQWDAHGVLYMRSMGLWPTKELLSYRIYGRHHKYEDIVR